ncbi:hypothetical protein FKP32DRAFT_1569305 [Trametes sanguinea]|nr:hypothetical protein FKP32DRAFT_1569305 [Trametes sanguinea]
MLSTSTYAIVGGNFHIVLDIVASPKERRNSSYIEVRSFPRVTFNDKLAAYQTYPYTYSTVDAHLVLHAFKLQAPSHILVPVLRYGCPVHSKHIWALLPRADSEYSKTQDLLCRLNDDVLRIIFEILRPQRCLRPLSITCRWIRDACCPVLFERCSLQSRAVDRPKEPTFIPRPLWVYVRSVYVRRPLNPSLDQRRIGRRDAAIRLGERIREALHSMPLLHCVFIWIPHGARTIGEPGVSPYVLEAMLSTPHLRRFKISGPLCHPEDPLPPGVTFSSLAPLSHFRYLLDIYRSPSEVTQTEKEVVLRILDHTRESLEVLICPSECSPLDVMGLWKWPRLQTLFLRGERIPTAPPLIHMLRKMPRLRTLSLRLAEPVNAAPPLIWPSSIDLECEWRELEKLVVAHPHPDDNLYSRLPDTLLDLSLQCWPRYYKHHTRFREKQRQARVQWSAPLLSSSEMLCIIRKIHAPHLIFLDLEFRADSGDDQLFRHISSAFPALTGLVIHRYRATDEGEAPLSTIADSLSVLQRLEVLMLHLDFTGLPSVDILKRSSWNIRSIRARSEQQMSDIAATFSHAANLFASRLGPALQYICFLRPLSHGTRQQWVPFRIVRSAGDVASAEKCQFRVTDSFQLPYGHRFT